MLCIELLSIIRKLLSGNIISNELVELLSEFDYEKIKDSELLHCFYCTMKNVVQNKKFCYEEIEYLAECIKKERVFDHDDFLNVSGFSIKMETYCLYPEFKELIQKIIEGEITRSEITIRMCENIDNEIILDSNDQLASDCYFSLLHYSCGEEEITKVEWLYLLECLYDKREFDFNDKFHLDEIYGDDIELKLQSLYIFLNNNNFAKGEHI